MMACHTKSKPVPTAATGFWLNATDAGSRTVCENLLLQSTVNAATDPYLADKTYGWNQSFLRETVWLWINYSGSSSQLVTVVFHGADGPNKQRYNVCFGISNSLGGSGANATLVSGLCASAAKQFASNNSKTTELYLWYATGEEPICSDPIYPALQAMITGGVVGTQTSASYPATGGAASATNQAYLPGSTTATRWPTSQSVYKFT
jgi:hypothetical protein